MRQRREIEGMSLSFLDTIACGFGAIILLLVITKVFEPVVLEESATHLEGLVAQLREELFDIRGEVTTLNRELISKEEQLSDEKERLARLQGELSRIRGRFAASSDESAINNTLRDQLASARQSMTEEMRRLLSDYRRPVEDTTVGGIPVDSEYVIFIIDTSGSMYNYAWDLAVEKVSEVLEVYPSVKGIQVLNDMGNYMFSQYTGKWIPDSPARRKAIVDRLKDWNAFSNSSPVEGIQRAISTYYSPDKKISIYVFGDEFTGRSIQDVVDTVDKINRAGPGGERLVRIHGIGFPVLFKVGNFNRVGITGVRFATLMRILCERNGGTFVGLQDIR
ncbi:MAG: VWA domain-containing protein [Gammaproteobacteria bacterium]|nr:VWA domain-containing protein [Gammaproteobacteria bacterium]